MNYVYGVFACAALCAPCACLQSPEEGPSSSGPGVTEGCKPPAGVLSALEEEPAEAPKLSHVSSTLFVTVCVSECVLRQNLASWLA